MLPGACALRGRRGRRGAGGGRARHAGKIPARGARVGALCSRARAPCGGAAGAGGRAVRFRPRRPLPRPPRRPRVGAHRADAAGEKGAAGAGVVACRESCLGPSAGDGFRFPSRSRRFRLDMSYPVQRWPDASHINLHEEAIMYARLTTFRVKPDKMDEMRRWREANEAAIYAQPGLRHWTGLADDQGEVLVLALFDDERAAREALPHASALWKQMAPML